MNYIDLHTSNRIDDITDKEMIINCLRDKIIATELRDWKYTYNYTIYI